MFRQSKHTEKVKFLLNIPLGLKEKLQEIATSKKISVTQLIIDSIMKEYNYNEEHANNISERSEKLRNFTKTKRIIKIKRN